MSGAVSTCSRPCPSGVAKQNIVRAARMMVKKRGNTNDIQCGEPMQRP